MVTADFNGDGVPDVAVLSKANHTVSVFLGTSTGALTAGQTFNTRTAPTAILAVDRNGDGKMDIAVAAPETAGGDITFYLNAGAGTFANGSVVSFGFSATAMAAGSLRAGDASDVVATGASAFEVLLSSGIQPYATPSGSVDTSVALTDVNGDGNVDLVIGSQTGNANNLFVYRNNGTGTFVSGTPSLSYPIAGSVTAVAAADFTGDGAVDLVPVSSPGNVYLRANQGGTFPGSYPFAVGSLPSAVATANLDNDANGTPDLAVANANGGPGVTVLLDTGFGSGTFTSYKELTGASTVAVATADFNGDGLPDLVALDAADSVVDVLLNQDTPPFAFTTGTVLNVRAAQATGPITINGSAARYYVAPATGQTYSFPPAAITSIAYVGTSGNDQLNLQGNLPVPLTFTGRGGSDTISVAAAASVILAGDPGAATTVTDAGSVTVAAGTNGAGVHAVHLAALNLTSSSAGATLAMPTSTSDRTLLAAGTLSVADGGHLDIGDGDVDLTATSLAAIAPLVASGDASGAWAGAGINSSAAAADAAHLTAVGVAQNVGTDGVTPMYATFDGQSVTANDVLLRYTYYGDANLSGTPDVADYTRIDAGYIAGETLSGWANGDFNYDGLIDGSDYTLIDNAFNEQAGGIPSLAAAASTPSPVNVYIAAVVGSAGRSTSPSSGSCVEHGNASDARYQDADVSMAVHQVQVDVHDAATILGRSEVIGTAARHVRQFDRSWHSSTPATGIAPIPSEVRPRVIRVNYHGLSTSSDAGGISSEAELAAAH
jgi:hypothetical protein